MNASDALEFLLVGPGRSGGPPTRGSRRVRQDSRWNRRLFPVRGIPSVAHFVGSLKESRQSTIFST